MNLLAREAKEEEIKCLWGHDTGCKFYTDQGWYSMHVLEKALQRVNLEMVDLRGPDPRAIAAIYRTAHEDAYICVRPINGLNHCFTLRKFNNQWYKLDSHDPQVEELKVTGSGNQLEIFSSTSNKNKFTAIYIIKSKELEALKALKESQNI